MACMPMGQGKFGKWLKKQLQSISKRTEKPAPCQGNKAPLQEQRRPLADGITDGKPSHAAQRKKAAAALACASHHSVGTDDCSPRASSDQLSFGAEPTTTAARTDDHVQCKQRLERTVQDSLAETGNAATELSALRELLVAHIGQAAGSNNTAPSGQAPSMRAPAASLPPKKAVTGDDMQLLDLVEVLITDHRTSLLERKRLQQQLDSVQEVLHVERLEKERAAALADIRSEEAQHALEQLASRAVLAQQMQHRRTISSTRIKLPPAGCSRSRRDAQEDAQQAAAEHEDSSPDMAANGWQQQSKQARQPGHRTATCSSKQGPGQPRTAKPSVGAGAGLTAERSRGSSMGRQLRSAVVPAGKAAADKITPTRASRAAALSLRPGARAAPAAGGGAGKGPVAVNIVAAGAGNTRRLLGPTAAANPAGLQQGNQQEQEHAQRAGAHDNQQEEGLEQQHKHSRWNSGQPQAQAAGADAHTQALEQLLASESSGVLDAAPQQTSYETQASSLSVSAGPDAMVGMTRELLHKVLQRPWLPHTQEPADTGAAADSHHSSSSHAVRAAAGGQESQQEPSSGSLTAGNSPGDAQSLNAVIESRSSGSGSVYASQMHQQVAAPAAESSSSASACAAPRDTGSSAAPAQQTGQKNPPGAASSNGSWPGMKVSAAGNSQAGAAVLQPPHRQSPLKPRSTSIRLRGRSRAQPQQLSTSLESAAMLPLQGAPADERSSRGSSVGNTGPQEGAAGWARNSLAIVQEEQQHWQHSQQGISGAPSGSSNLAADNSTVSHGADRDLSRDNSSQAGCAPERSESEQPASKQRRRWLAGPAGPQPQQLQCPDTHAQPQQRQHALPQKHVEGRQHPVQQQQQQQLLPRQHSGQSSSAATCAADTSTSAAAAEPPALSKKHLQALAASASMHSSGELSGGTSDLACMSTTSAATGCTTLSGLAGVYLQHPSKPAKMCPRPSFVPKLELQGVADGQQVVAGTQVTQQHQLQQPQQHALQAQARQVTPCSQQQQQGQGQPIAAAATGAAGCQQEQHTQVLTPCSSTGHHLGSARSYLTAEELADIAPLRAHTSSRRHSSAAGAVTPVTSAGTTLQPAAEAVGGHAKHAPGAAGRCTPRASRSSTGSISSAGSGQVASAGVQQEHSSGRTAGLPPSGAGLSPGSAHTQKLHRAGGLPACGESSSNAVQRTSGGGVSTGRVYRPSSGGGNSGLPAPGGMGYWGSSAGGSNPASENPSRQPTPRRSDAAAGPGAAGRASSRSRPSTAGGAAPPSASTGAAAGQHSTAGVPAAAAAAAPVGGHGPGVVLTAIPQPCAASATAAAASSFMTMRPAHLYRSVSTVYAMYSPLMGNLRALGHSRAASHLSVASSSHEHSHTGIDPASAAAAAVAAAHGQHAVAAALACSHSRPEVPTFAGLASMTTTTVLEPHAGAAAAAAPEADVAAAVAAAAAAAHEYHWQALLGGCPPVPEDGSLHWQDRQQEAGATAAAATAAGAAVISDHAPRASAAAEAAPGAAAEADAIGAAAPAAPARPRRSQVQAGAAAAAQQPRGTATAHSRSAPAAAAAAAAPAAATQQSAAAAAVQSVSSRLQQRAQQHLQVEVPVAFERDVIERGPVLPPTNMTGGPMALSPHRQRMGSSPTRLMSPLAAAAAAVARDVGDTGASSPLLAAAEAGAPVGPLTAASPTRVQWQRGQGSNHSRNQRGRSVAAAAPRQQQQHRPQQQQQVSRNRSRPMSPGRAAAIEAAAASVAAHVAAAAQLIQRQERRISNSQLLQQPEAPPAPQQQRQEVAKVQAPIAAPNSRQHSQGVQVQMEAETPLQQQQQQAGALELDCSLCCFSPMSAAGDGVIARSWVQGASPHSLVAAASATVDSLMVQAEALGLQCLSHRSLQQQAQQQQMLPQGFNHSSLEGKLHGTSSSDMGRLSSTSSMVLAHQQLMPPPPPRPQRDAKVQRTPGSNQKRRSRGRWHQQAHQQEHTNPLYQRQPGEAPASAEQQLFVEHRTPPRSSRSTSRSRHHQHGSAVKLQPAYRTARTPPMSPGAAAALQLPEELMVQTYQNPLLALEAAGFPDLGSSVDTELVSAVLLPGLVEHLAQQASEASSFGGGGFGLQGGAGSCEAGVSAAAVPVHMTPLAKDRSLKMVGAQQGLDLSREGSAAGGQLHWNPLFRTGEDLPLAGLV